LILFELLYRYEDAGDNRRLNLLDDSESLCLSKVLGYLERTLVEPFYKNYDELLNKAKAELKPQIED
jgi:hypothetical protein